MDDMESQLRGALGGTAPGMVQAAGELVIAYKVLRRLVVDEYGDDVVDAAFIHANATDDEMVCVRRVEKTFASLRRKESS